MVLWRQCIDLLAQFDHAGPHAGDGDDLDRVVEALERIRPDINLTQKVASVVELGSRLRSHRLVRLLLKDAPPVIVATMKRARLSDAQWSALVSEAGPLARSVLRQREDIGPDTRSALEVFGPIDMSLADLSSRHEAFEIVAEAERPGFGARSTSDESDQIRRIVDRIERFTSERHGRAPGASADAAGGASGGVEAPVEQFTFETDGLGVITAVMGAPAAALLGLSLGSPSLDNASGPDGQILGAFRHRSAYRNGRLAIEGGVAEGNWLVDADPLFDVQTGRFTGYRGAARRASALESPPHLEDAQAPAPAGSELTLDTPTQSASIRQLIHELRTPLNGIMGFAEIIESQLLGPVSDGYRDMAGQIVGDVRSLVDILEDLDYANRSDPRQQRGEQEPADLQLLLDAAIQAYALDARGNPRIQLGVGRRPVHLDMAPSAAERMILHLVRALAACVGGETLDADVGQRLGMIELRIARPTAMMQLTERQIFDSGYDQEGTGANAPVLGVGFALRLVRRMAAANGGRFELGPAHFSLNLPAAGEPCNERNGLR
jgi:signal transduction histidine kinase